MRRAVHMRVLIGSSAIAGSLVLAGDLALAATEMITDQMVSDAVEDELRVDPAVPVETIDVDTAAGVVTLSGTVDNLLAEERAVRIAETVKGVRSVIERIDVRPALALDAEGIERDVEHTLMADPATETWEIDVTVGDGGTVRLSGTVDSWQERELAATVAKGVHGVTDVQNDIQLDSPPERPDAEIEAEVERVLHWDVLVHDGLIDVVVTDGEVHLGGTVGSAAEKTRATSKSWVNGVQGVDGSTLRVERWARDPDLRATKFVAKSDDEIRQAVQDALLYDPRVALFDVAVEVDSGQVTLRGEVDNLAARRAAEQDARHTVGVTAVVDRIRVRPGDALDDEIADAIRSALSRDAHVDRYDLAVLVSNGTARLYGTVDNWFEKARADTVADRVAGVIAVDNNLVVLNQADPLITEPYLYDPPALGYDWYAYDPPGSLRPDSEIAAAIEDELWWSPFVDDAQVKVEVDQGIATLSGTVDSWAERSAAIENTWEGGAVWVIDDLRVEPTEGES